MQHIIHDPEGALGDHRGRHQRLLPVARPLGLGGHGQAQGRVGAGGGREGVPAAVLDHDAPRLLQDGEQQVAEHLVGAVGEPGAGREEVEPYLALGDEEEGAVRV